MANDHVIDIFHGEDMDILYLLYISVSYGWSVSTQFIVFPISTSVDRNVCQYGKMFYFL